MQTFTVLVCALFLMVVFTITHALLTTHDINVPACTCTQKKPFADQIVTLLVGPDELGMPMVDCDYARYSGKVTSINMYLMSLYSDRDGAVPTENMGQTITIRLNGKPVVERMLVTILPSHTNIDLSEVCERMNQIESRDTLSLEVFSEENAFRSVTVGFGISAHD
jgi:hypothetical protein